MIKSINYNGLFIPLIILIVLIVSSYLKIVPVLNYNFPFTMDQARDMLDIRHIVIGKHPSLIGPTTSINGVFLGPFYYYANVPPFILGQGDPSFLVYWNILWYLLAGLALWFFNRKENPLFALISSILFLMAPSMFYSSRYFWSANPMPPLVIFYFLSLIFNILYPSKRKSLLLGLISGFGMQVEAAFGVLLFPFAFLTLLFRRNKIKNVAIFCLGFFVTLLPQILFELRHQFIMTKTFLSELSGSSQILGEKLTFVESAQSHLSSFIEFVNGILELPGSWSFYILIAGTIYLAYLTFAKKLDKFLKIYFLTSVTFLIYAFIFYLAYPHGLKGWYLLALRIPYLFILAAFFSEIVGLAFKNKNLLYKIPALAVAIIIAFSFFTTFNSQKTFIPKEGEKSGDKSNFRNEVEAIDWVYDKAAGRGFKAYNYIPSVYDFPYQYLYWWHGTRKYGYQPEVLTYQDNVPEYVIANDNYLTKRKPADDNLTFLIYEKDETEKRLHAWLGNFTKYCPLEKVSYPWGTTVEMRKPCP